MDGNKQSEVVEARRRFLASCGRFAVITPPVMTVLLSSTAQNYAAARSGHGNQSLSFGNNGFGNGGGDGVPGRSGDNRSPQAESKKVDERR